MYIKIIPILSLAEMANLLLFFNSILLALRNLFTNAILFYTKIF